MSTATAMTAVAQSETAALPTRVLLIDDNEETLWLVKFLLEESEPGSYDLQWTDRLGGGIDLLLSDGADVVLLDLGLPGCNGVVSYILVHQTAPGVPIVVLTADHREQTVEQVLNSGADDYLVKDEVSGQQLVRALRGAIYRHKIRNSNNVPSLLFRGGAWHWQAIKGTPPKPDPATIRVPVNNISTGEKTF